MIISIFSQLSEASQAKKKDGTEVGHELQYTVCTNCSMGGDFDQLEGWYYLDTFSRSEGEGKDMWCCFPAIFLIS